MAFGQDFLNSFFGNDFLKDYTHASKTFRTNGYENSPRLKFLFHVYFNLNTTAIPPLRQIFNSTDSSTVGLLVKNIELPKYQIEVDTMNQYNRKRLIQKKINYQPVRCVFHDDGGDLIRTMWYNYYAYYYKDPNQPYRNNTPAQNGAIGVNANRTQGFDYNNRDIYANDRFVNDWGYIGESYADGTQSGVPGSTPSKPPFFRDISIYGFNQHKFVEYVLINPMITEWNHDTYDYQVQSPIGRPGGTQSILGQGGLLDAGLGIYQDLQAGSVAGVIGAVQKAGTAYNTFKGKDLRAIARAESQQGVQQVIQQTLPGVIRNQPVGSASTTIQQRLNAPVFPIPKRQT